jgi:hypothetical protein
MQIFMPFSPTARCVAGELSKGGGLVARATPEVQKTLPKAGPRQGLVAAAHI